MSGDLIIFSPLAERDLREIYSYTLGKYGKLKADSLFEYIEKKCGELSKSPYLGRKSAITNVRELILKKYPFIILYNAKISCIEVVRVYHTSRDPLRTLH